MTELTDINNKNKAVFLDRDGVINVDHGYIYQPEKFEFIDGVFDACLKFQQAGYKIIVVTNQSGIGRGYYSEADFQHLTSWMVEQFKQNSVDILDVYFCPHHPTNAQSPYLKDCDCRKPKPGMLLQGLKQHNLDAATSIMVGDKSSDMKAAIAAKFGQKYLVTSGQSLSEQDKQLADATYNSLIDLTKHHLD
ncbi:MAG: D-glycero-beta-D-manno-heptose 1,7-bisphosphate 7-phosphatase [Gammaproteobacteria bacterium]|nr:D-glycero-beta-D-manno-heptose 1,7-bisphosphate 7-phosphatase [Gammaproteobacteria bacterium]